MTDNEKISVDRIIEARAYPTILSLAELEVIQLRKEVDALHDEMDLLGEQIQYLLTKLK